MSKISVLIVTYNYGAYLKPCLESILAQDYKEELEILVVDDGSTDDTGQVVQAFSQVRYIYQEHKGVGSARNRALKEATGDFFAFCDADDIWKKEKLRIQMDYLREHPDCQIVFTGYENFLEKSVVAEEKWVKNCISFAREDRNCLPTALFRRELFFRMGGFSEELERGEDTEWSRRLRIIDAKSGYIDQCLYLRRLHGNNLTQKSDKDTLEDSYKLYRDVFFKSIRNTGKKTNFLEDGISVIIPVWNGEAYIKECIESVARQQADFAELPIEIIVADDGSTDNTVAIARDCGATVYELAHKGTSAAKNSGVIKAKYSYVIFLDADDRLTEGSLKSLYDTFEEKPMLTAVFSHARDFYTEKTDELSGAVATERVSSRVYSGCLPGCGLIRKSVFRKIGLFNESLQTGETVDWMARFRDSGLSSELIDAVTLERRIHETNTGKVLRSQEQQDYARILRERLRQRKEGKKDAE